MGRPGAGGGARPSVGRSSGSVHRVSTRSSGSTHRVSSPSRPVMSSSPSRPTTSTHKTTTRPTTVGNMFEGMNTSYNSRHKADEPKKSTYQQQRHEERRTPPPPPPKYEERRMPPPPRREERLVPPPPPPIIIERSAQPVRRTTPVRTPVIHNTYVNTTPTGGLNCNNGGGSYNESRSKKILNIAITVAVIFTIICTIAVWQSSKKEQESSLERTKVESGLSYVNDCVVDELGWLNTSKVSKGLKQFYEDTGCQPYILLHASNGESYTDDEAYAHATEYYDTNFAERQNVVLYAYYESSDPNEIGPMCLIHGTLSGTIMDSEAEEIFWNQLDADWSSYTEDQTDEMFIHIFSATGNKIMYHSTNGWDVLNAVIILVTGVVVAGALVIALREIYRRQREKAAETERILSASLSDLAEEKSDELLDKYK